MSIAREQAPAAASGRGAWATPALGATGAAAPFGAALLGVVFAWWAWQEGAYFPAVLLPGLFVLCLGTTALALTTRRIRDRRVGLATKLATAAMLALAAWSAVSALWSPAPNLALGDAQRIAAYGLALGLGGWIALAAGNRRELALFPLALAGLIAGVVATYVLLAGESPVEHLNPDGTLQAPLDYRNATAAFFLLAFLAAVGLASARRVDWRVRGLACASATMCAGLAVLCQSRASLPAFVLALIVLILFAPLKLRALCWVALALLPALLVIPSMAELYAATDDTRLAVVGPQMQDAGFTVAITSGASLAAGLLVAYMGSHLPGFGSRSRRSNPAVLIGLLATAIAAVGAFLIAVGDPGEFVDERLREFRSLETPGFDESSTRFGVNAGTGRLDFWEVALAEWDEDLLKGSGGGAFAYDYALERSVEKDARDAHSVELEVGSELGLVGFGLLALAVGAAVAGAWRARRLGERAAGVSAFALAAGAYWLAHGSVDWLWSVPAVTAPALALLAGAGCVRPRSAADPGPEDAVGESPAEDDRGVERSPGWALRAGSQRERVPKRRLERLIGAAPRLPRAAMIVALLVLALTTVPPFLSQAYVDDAAELRLSDTGEAYQALERAQRLDPLDDIPHLLEGQIALLAGDDERARRAFEEAIRVRPAEWAGHYYLAVLWARSDRPAALDELAAARELNPLERCLEDVEAALDCAPKG